MASENANETSLAKKEDSHSSVEPRQNIQVITQKGLRYKAVFEFQDEKIKYFLRVAGSEVNRTLSCIEIDLNNSDHHIEQNVWFRNTGMLWTALGVLIPGFWYISIVGLLLIGGSYAFRLRYSSYNTNGGAKILIFDGANKEKILSEIKKRRVPLLRKMLCAINYGNTKEQELKKFEFLKNEEAISETEYNLYISQINEEAHRFA